MRLAILLVLLSLALNSAAATGRIFVSNEKGDSVSVIDSKIVGEAPVRGVAANGDLDSLGTSACRK